MSNRPRVPTVVPQLTPSERAALAGVTGALALAALGALVVVPARSDAAVGSGAPQVAAQRLTPRPSTPAAPVVREGRVLTPVSGVAPLAVAVDDVHPAALRVVVPTGTRVVDCNLVHPTVRVTAQTATFVRISVSGSEWVPKAAVGSGGTTCVTAGAVAVPVPLSAPLGTRRVYDGTSPAATVLVDPSDLPSLATKPAGYRQVSVSPAAPVAGRLVGERTYAAGSDRLVVRVGSRDAITTPSQQTGSGLVDGQYATVARDATQQCVTWTELSGRVRQVCSTPPGTLDPGTLLGLARGLTEAG